MLYILLDLAQIFFDLNDAVRNDIRGVIKPGQSDSKQKHTLPLLSQEQIMSQPLIQQGRNSQSKPHEEVKTNAQTQACYGVEYENPILNEKNLGALFEYAQVEGGGKGIDDLIAIGTNSFKYSTLKFLMNELGDGRAVRVILNYDKPHDQSHNQLHSGSTEFTTV